MKPLVAMLTFGLVAAIGNAIFVFGNRKAQADSSPMLFVAGGLIAAAAMLVVISPLFPLQNTVEMARQNWLPMALCGLGTAITYVGFYFLYTSSGASSYAVYAMLSLLTTSVGVGAIIFREKFTLWHGLAIIAAFASLAFFFIGQRSAAKASEDQAVIESA